MLYWLFKQKYFSLKTLYYAVTTNTILFIIFFSYSNVYATSPINENLIKYRYLIKTLSMTTEAKDDMVLPFELDCTYNALKSEIINASKNYAGAFDYISMNYSLQPQTYEEFFKMLREKLAADGIFPTQYDNLSFESNTIETELFIKFTNLRNKLRDPEPGNSAEAAYQKAINHMKAGYNYYCENDYNNSSSEFGQSIEHWKVYYKFNQWNENNINYAIARIRILQGCILVDGENYGVATICFNEAIKLYEQCNDSFWSNYFKIFKAEILYRQNKINEFIAFMDKIKYNKNAPELNEHNEIICRGNIIYEEYRRLSMSNYSIMAGNVQLSRENHIKRIESLKNEPYLNEEYIIKFLKHSEKILEYSSFEIISLSFESSDKYLKLKDHKTASIIECPQWQKIKTTQNNYDSISIKKQSVALITGNKMEILVGIYSLTGIDPTWDLIGRTIINGKEVKFKNCGIVSRAENTYIHKFESDEDFTNRQVKVVPLEIEWWLKTFDKNSTKEFSLGKTSHKIYIVRKKVAEPCYWQIVEYTCNWMKDLSPSQLTEDRNVIDAIWKGCSIENLNKLKYRYQYPAFEGEDNGRLPELLKNKRGKCGQWMLFLRHCFYCQGIKNVNTFGTGGDQISFYFIKNFIEGNNNLKCQYYKSLPFIGKKDDEKMPAFSDHAFVGYGGKIVNSQYGQTYEGGEFFDIVFYKRIANSSPLIYENIMVENIIDENGSIRPKNTSIQEFLFFCVKPGTIDPVPEKLKLNEVIENE